MCGIVGLAAGAVAAPLAGPRDSPATLPLVIAQAESGGAPAGQDAAAGSTEAETGDAADAPEDDPAADGEGPADDAAAEGETAADAPEPAADEGEVDASDEFAVLRSPDRMPEPVRRTWQALVDAARSGNIENLRLLIDVQPSPPIFSFSEIDDPIDYLKSLSGDAAGREILAILLEILEAGYMHVDRGTPQEMYLWPYFARYPLARLTPREIVEMFTILTAGDYQDMLSYGAYIFFRVGIGPDGTWHFFVAGD